MLFEARKRVGVEVGGGRDVKEDTKFCVYVSVILGQLASQPLYNPGGGTGVWADVRGDEMIFFSRICKRQVDRE